MPDVSPSILEMIQEKERELAFREAKAKEDAIALLQKAERDAEEFLREQILLARDEASQLYEQHKAAIEKQKEQMLISQQERLREMEKTFQQRFQTAVNQVLQRVWDVQEPKIETERPSEQKVMSDCIPLPFEGRG